MSNQYRRRMVTGDSRYAQGKNQLLPLEDRLKIMAAKLPGETLTQAAVRLKGSSGADFAKNTMEMAKRHMEKAHEKNLLKKVFESKDNADLDKYHAAVQQRQNRRLKANPALAERIERRVDRKVALHEKERQTAMADPQIRKAMSERNERRLRDAGRASGIHEMVNASGHVVKTPDGPIMYHRDKQKDALEFAKANKPGSLERKMALSIAKMHGSEKRGMLGGSLARGTAGSTVHGGGGKKFDAITSKTLSGWRTEVTLPDGSSLEYGKVKPITRGSATKLYVEHKSAKGEPLLSKQISTAGHGDHYGKLQKIVEKLGVPYENPGRQAQSEREAAQGTSSGKFDAIRGGSGSGKGRGNWGHKGRPGKRGGSA